MKQDKYIFILTTMSHILIGGMISLLTTIFCDYLGLIVIGIIFITSLTLYFEMMAITSINTNLLIQKNRFIGDADSLRMFILSFKSKRYLLFCILMSFISCILLFDQNIVYFFFLLLWGSTSYIIHRALYGRIEGIMSIQGKNMRMRRNVSLALLIYGLYFLFFIIRLAIINKQDAHGIDEIVFLGGGMFASQALLVHLLRSKN